MQVAKENSINLPEASFQTSLSFVQEIRLLMSQTRDRHIGVFLNHLNYLSRVSEALCLY